MASTLIERREHIYRDREWLNSAEHRMAAIAVDLSLEKSRLEGAVMISDCFHTIRLEFGEGRENVTCTNSDVLLTVLRKASGKRSTAATARDRHE